MPQLNWYRENGLLKLELAKKKCKYFTSSRNSRTLGTRFSTPRGSSLSTLCFNLHRLDTSTTLGFSCAIKPLSGSVGCEAESWPGPIPFCIFPIYIFPYLLLVATTEKSSFELYRWKKKIVLNSWKVIHLKPQFLQGYFYFNTDLIKW